MQHGLRQVAADDGTSAYVKTTQALDKHLSHCQDRSTTILVSLRSPVRANIRCRRDGDLKKSQREFSCLEHCGVHRNEAAALAQQALHATIEVCSNSHHVSKYSNIAG